MKTGKVIVGALSHKNLDHVFKEFDNVTENDVENWDELVKKSYIKPDKSTANAEEKDKKEAQEKEEKDKKEAKEKRDAEIKVKKEAQEKKK